MAYDILTEVTWKNEEYLVHSQRFKIIWLVMRNVS